MFDRDFPNWVVKKSKILLSLLALLLSIITISYLKVSTSILNSDKVVDYLLMKELASGEYLRLWYPPDSFLHRIPFVYLFDLLFGLTTTSLLFISTIDFVLMYSIFGVGFYFLIRKLGISEFWIFLITYLSFVIYSSYSLHLSNLMANPFGRSTEIALSFLFFYFLLVEEKKEFKLSKLNFIKLILVFVLLVLLLTSDPFITFTFYIPLSIFLFLRFLLNKSTLVSNLYLVLILNAVVFSFILKVFLRKLGIVIYSDNATFTNIEGIFTHITYLIKDILFLYNANFTGLPLFSMKTGLILSNLCLLFASLAGLLVLFFKKVRELEPVSLFLFILFTLNLLIFLVSNRAADNSLTVHYLVLLPFIVIFGLANIIYYTRSRVKFTVLLFVLLFISVSTSAYYHLNNMQKTNIHKNNQSKLVAILKENNLQYGYGGFWDAGISTFLSSNEVRTRQVVCLGGKIYPFYWASSESWYKAKAFSGQSFVIHDENDFFTKTCTEDLLEKQFGKAERKVGFEGKIIYIWGYNISSKFDTTRKKDRISPFTVN